MLKNYKYLSYDHERGVTQWKIFYSEFTHQRDLPASKSSELVKNAVNESQILEKQLFVKGSIMYTMKLNEEGKPVNNWVYKTDTPIFQVLSIDRGTSTVTGVPLNMFHDKDNEKIKIVFIGEYIYADHTYLQLPDFPTYALPHKDSENFPIATITEEFTEIIVPVLYKGEQDSIIKISDN